MCRSTPEITLCQLTGWRVIAAAAAITPHSGRQDLRVI